MRIPAALRRRRLLIALLAVVLLALAAGALAAKQPSARGAQGGLTSVRAPAQLSLSELAGRGLWLRVDVVSGTRALRLELVRQGGRRVRVSGRVGIRGAGRRLVRWHLSAAALRRMRSGRYVLSARAERGGRHATGRTRRVHLRLVGRLPPAPGATAARPSSSTPCGVASEPPPAWHHVIWVVMENTGYSGIIGAKAAPYLNALAARCGLATNYTAATHPSLPNYIAMTSGSPQGISDDGPPSKHPLSVPSIFSQLAGDWRSLQESMPGPCPRADSGKYKVKHDPAAYYTNIPCATQDVPLTDPPDLSARFTQITPNICNDMHDCGVAAGDAWLSQWVPKLMDSAQYRAGQSAILITWDEDDRAEANHIATFVIAPSTPAGARGATAFTHQSLLRTTEELLGLPLLPAVVGATSMRADFHL